MKFSSLIGLAALALFSVSSCKKKEGDNEKLDPNDNSTIGVYMPTTPGSWWKFKGNHDGDAKTVIRYATGKDSLINGFNYDYFESKDSASQWITPEYFSKNNDNYIMLVDLDGSQTNYINAIVYKENASVGNTWLNTHEMSYSGFNVDVEIRGEVVGVNVTQQINGIDYTNVLQTKNELFIKHPIATLGIWTKVGTIKM